MTMDVKAVGRRGWRYLLNLVLFGMVVMVIVIEIVGAVAGYNDVETALHPTREIHCCDTPDDAGIAYEEVVFRTNDHLNIRGWYLPASGETAVIMAHGSSANRMQLWRQAVSIHQAGHGVVLMDLRAHGESDGTVFARGWLDILGAVHWLQLNNVRRIGAYGFSLGADMVIQAAAESSTIQAVVADGPSPVTLSDMPLPSTLLAWLYLSYDLVYWSQLEARSTPYGGFGVRPMRQAVTMIAPRPLLIIASGAESSGFEVRMAETLYASAGEPRSLWVVPDVYHGGAFDAHPSLFLDHVVGFFDCALKLPSAGSGCVN